MTETEALDDGSEPRPIEAFRRSPLRSLDVAEAESHLPPWTRELLACLRSRARAAFVLRQAGMACSQIGLHLGVSSSRVRQLCAAAERRMVVAARRGAVFHRGALPAHVCTPSSPCPVPGSLRHALDLPLDSLDLSVRSHAGLSNRGVACVGQLVRRSEMDVLKFPHIGTKSFREIVGALARIGLHLGMDVGDWTSDCPAQA